jgi:hypothetical protein
MTQVQIILVVSVAGFHSAIVDGVRIKGMRVDGIREPLSLR